MCLVFSNEEMREFMKSIKTQTGKPDRMFGFGFDSPNEVLLTRGNADGMQRDYSAHLFKSKCAAMKTALASS